MPISSNTWKLKLLAYDENSNIDNSVITKGSYFDITGNYFVFINKPVPKYSKVYVEFEVTDCDMTNEIRHIPLMVGISKEPSKGYHNTDYCIGSLYYTKNTWAPAINPSAYLAYTLMEKYGYVNPIVTYQSNVSIRPPIKNTVIGLGIDMLHNTINIYTDGVFFYGFSPDYFHINDSPNIYISIYSLEMKKHIKGVFRFGKESMKYNPVIYIDGVPSPNGEHYNGLYDELYLKHNIDLNIPAQVTTGFRYSNSGYEKKLLTGNLNVDNDLAPINTAENRRDLEIIIDNDNMRYYNDIYKLILNKHAFQYTPRLNNTDCAYINFPLDKFEKLYFEMSCYNATLQNSYLGIPLQIGLTKYPTFLERESVTFNLFHAKEDADSILQNAIFVKDDMTEYDFESLHADASYITTYYSYGFKMITNTNYEIFNPVYPSQPTTLGILIDLHNHTVEIYAEGVLFITFSLNKDIIDFSLPEEPVYFFFKAAPEYVLKRTGYVICNFGTKNTLNKSYMDDDFKYFLFSGDERVKGLWDYYNLVMKEIYHNDADRSIDIISTIKVIEEKLVYGKNIFCRIIVPDTTIQNEQWTPGLNKLWSSYNKVSNSEPANNVPDKSIYDLQKMIKSDEVTNRR